jgi:hypothetical protein
MTDNDKNESEAVLPDPRLRSFDKLVGTWDLKHRDLNTGREWLGRDTFEWMDGGFFLAYHHEEFENNVKGLMIIGYEKKWGEEKPSEEVIGHWFESSTGSHYTYIWEADDKSVTFWLESKDSGMAFKGMFSDDHKTVSGTWKWPGGGYDLVMTKVENK